MDREMSPPMLAAGVLAVIVVLVLCWFAFLAPRGGADPRLQQKAQQLKQRRQNVAPPVSQ